MGVLIKIWYVLVFVLLIGLLLYGDNHNLHRVERFNLDKYLDGSGVYEGHKGQRFGKIVNISQDHFYFDIGSHTIKIMGSGVEGAVYGETVLFIDFRGDGVMELINHHNYDYNYLLYIISFFAFLVFLFIFFKEWRITIRGFENA
jgi:hypothetical protein